MKRKPLTKEHKLKVSISLKKFWKERGQGHSKGIKLTEEHKNKIKNSCKGINKGSKNGNYVNGLASSIQERGEEWEKIRKQIYKRDNWTCQECSKTKCRVEVHHKVPWRISKDNSPENLETLCKSCHKKKDNLLIKKEKECQNQI
jgi:membrane protease subunit (stomatin/prohibitin family)